VGAARDGRRGDRTGRCTPRRRPAATGSSSRGRRLRPARGPAR
jgi:hypothetical protein